MCARAPERAPARGGRAPRSPAGTDRVCGARARRGPRAEIYGDTPPSDSVSDTVHRRL